MNDLDQQAIVAALAQYQRQMRRIDTMVRTEPWAIPPDALDAIFLLDRARRAEISDPQPKEA